jgi:thioredoxin reductase
LPPGYLFQYGFDETLAAEIFYLRVGQAGDIRSGSPRQVVSAVGDGAIAAIMADRKLQEEG